LVSIDIGAVFLKKLLSLFHYGWMRLSMKKNKNIAIVGGGGVTAAMTALACARKGISVDFFLDDRDYDDFKTSFGNHCLWRRIHENNQRLSRLCTQSQWMWEKFILSSSGEFGRKEKMVRIVERSEIPHLARLYEQHDLPYEVKNGGDDESINFPSFLNGKNKSVFVSYDSILLNTAEIFSYFQDELAFFTSVNVFRNKNIGDLNSIESGVIFFDENKRMYDTVIKFTNGYNINEIVSPFEVCPAVNRVFRDYYLSHSVGNLLSPMMITEREFNLWIVPSVDGKIVRVGGDIHVPQSAEFLTRSLDIGAYIDRRKLDIISDSLFTIISSFSYVEGTLAVVPCWTASEDNKKIVVVESVDSYYNASPIISEEITAFLTDSSN
ncbi:FAD-dependent oxidoreductase, partial [Serratia nevei]|uniref:FAD-dependent oxidoreductase n=1 Tax=Serratia nevei TaxID=2703794 RepID=UPI003F80A0F2